MKIKILNNIAKEGLDLLSDFTLVPERGVPDRGVPQSGEEDTDCLGIVLRSHKLQASEVYSETIAVSRAGAGVNNIPIPELSKRGVVVMNTPGANANAVKELVLAAMLLQSRNLFKGKSFVDNLVLESENLKSEIESEKKKFVGSELQGKTLGIVGLGAIGVMLANSANALGMKVVGYDPALSVENAWRLSSNILRAQSVDQVYQESDYLSFHVPLIEATKNLFNSGSLESLKSGCNVLNFSRGPIVDSSAIIEGIKSGKVASYSCDFPESQFKDYPNIYTFPHLGASTVEAQINCATAACQQLRNFIKTGSIKNSVNLPDVQLGEVDTDCRLLIINENIPNVIGQVSGILAKSKFNIAKLINKSRDDFAYTVIDTTTPIDESTKDKIKKVAGVIRVRRI